MIKQFSASFPYAWFKYITLIYVIVLFFFYPYKITISNFRHVFVRGMRLPDSVIVSHTLNNRM